MVDATKRASYMRTWRLKNTERAREISTLGNKKYRERIRNALYQKYGTSCVLCGSVQNIDIDHIYGANMTTVERRGKRNATQEWREAIADNNGNFRILCHKCNCIERGKRQTYPNTFA